MSTPSNSAPANASQPPNDGEFNEGLEAFKAEDYEQAVEIFEKVYQKRVSQYGELCEESAVAAFHYGFSLLHVAQASKEVFVDKAEDEEPDEVGEETATDLSVAWEALECARRGLELTRDGCNHSRLAEIHVALGDVASEGSNFESAVEDYGKAISHLNEMQSTAKEGEPLFGSREVNRRFCEVYYKTCLANEYLENLELAAENCDKAIEAIRLEMQSADASVETDLKEIEKDLIERREAIEISIKESDKVKDMLRQMFQQNLTESGNAQDVGNAVDLGVVGRGKNRIQLSKIEEADEDETEQAPEASDTSAARKRVTSLVNDQEEAAIRSSKKKKTEDKETKA